MRKRKKNHCNLDKNWYSSQIPSPPTMLSGYYLTSAHRISFLGQIPIKKVLFVSLSLSHLWYEIYEQYWCSLWRTFIVCDNIFSKINNSFEIFISGLSLGSRGKGDSTERARMRVSDLSNLKIMYLGYQIISHPRFLCIKWEQYQVT